MTSISTKEEFTAELNFIFENIISEPENEMGEKASKDVLDFFNDVIWALPKNTFKNDQIIFNVYLTELWDSHYIARRGVYAFYKICYNFEKNFNRCQNNLSKNEIKNHPDLAKAYFTNTPLDRFFFLQLPFSIPFKRRFEHTHICAGSGHGKTQLLLSLIYADIKKALKGKGGLCVIDSQGDLIETLSHLAEFDPTLKKGLADKLVLIDPTDIDHPPQLNMFDVNLDRLGKNVSAKNREMIENATVAMFQYIFEDLGGGLGGAGYQQNIFENCSKLLLKIEGANILTFLELLRDGGKFKKHFSKLDFISKDFFENEFFGKEYENTKKQIAVRLRNILNNKTFARMMTAKKNKIDIFDAMNKGKIVLINTAKAYLQEDRCRMLGKLFIALTLQATFQRATIPEDKRKAFFVYIDEVQDYLSDSIANFLSQARKYKVGMIFAHQYLEQLSNISRNLVASVMANTSIKLMGRIELADAKKMADRMGRSVEDFRNLKKKDYAFTEYLCSIKDVVEPAVKISLPLGMVNKQPTMSDENFKILKNQQREKFCIGAGSEIFKISKTKKVEDKKDIAEDTGKIKLPSFPEL